MQFAVSIFKSNKQYTHTHTHSLTHSLTLTHSLSLSLSLSHTHTHTLALSPFPLAGKSFSSIRYRSKFQPESLTCCMNVLSPVCPQIESQPQQHYGAAVGDDQARAARGFQHVVQFSRGVPPGLGTLTLSRSHTLTLSYAHAHMRAHAHARAHTPSVPISPPLLSR